MLLSCFPELYFNVDSGYLEGLVRGFKAGVLSQADYVNLVQCESLEGGWRGGGGPPSVSGPAAPRSRRRDQRAAPPGFGDAPLLLRTPRRGCSRPLWGSRGCGAEEAEAPGRPRPAARRCRVGQQGCGAERRDGKRRKQRLFLLGPCAPWHGCSLAGRKVGALVKPGKAPDFLLGARLFNY